LPRDKQSFANNELDALIGSACDDGNDETIFDQIQSGCSCAGVIPAENSDCQSATIVGVGIYETTGPVSGSGASNLCGSAGSDAVWFEFIAEDDGLIEINSSNDEGVNTNLSVYSGCEGICLGSNDN